MRTMSPGFHRLTLIALIGMTAVVLSGVAPRVSAAQAQAAAPVTPVNISKSSADSTFDYPGNGSVHSLGVDRNGKAYVIWYEWLNPRRFTFATNKSGTWSTPVEIEQLNWESNESGFPVMDVSPAGNLHLMYHDGRGQMIDADIFHKSLDNGVWSGTTNVSGVGTGPSVYGGLAVSPVDGTVVVVWGENRADVPGEWLLIQRSRSANGTWSPLYVLQNYTAMVWGYFPRLAIDAKGTVHMVYGYAHTSTLWYTKNATPSNPAGWTTPVRLRDTGIDWSFYDVACDDAGNAYVAWDDAMTGNEEILVRKINANGTFGSIVNVSNSPSAVSAEPTLAVNKTTGDLLVAWTENGNIYANASVGGSWTGAANLTNSTAPCMQPCVAIDPAGGAHIVYATQAGGNWEIMYASYSGGITVQSPNGGETWYAASSHNITWAASGVSGNVKIEYSTNAGQSWSTVAASAANTGSYAWTVPATLSTQCLVRVSSLDGTLTDRSDSAFTIATAPTAMIQLSRTTLAFGALVSSVSTAAQTVVVSNSGTGAMNWTAASNRSWLSVSPASGSGTGVLTISVNPSGLSPDVYSGSVAVSSAAAGNSPRLVAVTLNVFGTGLSAGPVGYFDSPLDGTTVASSIPVTGWALDDIEVASLKLYREAAVGLIYIGDAVFIDGARPDIEQIFVAYPRNSRAGWGYMLLTNSLPDGVLTLVAIATDKEGHNVELGRRWVVFNNAAAVNPFGAIDTPAQGGTASGAAYINFGWALTPPPSAIPTDGSTITVYIDGVSVGHPTYNQYRSDVAAAFPGYLNSAGAVGYLALDTTKYANGLHTIYWYAADNVGHSDGIGSRFFTVLNGSGSPEAAAASLGAERFVLDASALDVVPSDPAPLFVSRGVGKVLPAPIFAGRGGAFEVQLRETGRLEVDLGRAREDDRLSYKGYLRVGNELRVLPAGSTLDGRTALFAWQPGPGYLGLYELVFVAERIGRPESKTVLRVRIAPY